jgi:ribosomal protein S11
MKKFNFIIFKRNFATLKLKKKLFDTTKFIKQHEKKIVKIFEKNFLVDAMTFNTIYFCIKNRELSNIANFVKPVVIALNSISKTFLKSKLNYLSKFYFKNWIKKKLFFDKFLKLMFITNKFSYYNILLIWKIINENFIKPNLILKKKSTRNFLKITKNSIVNENKKPLINGFLFIRSTRNNFFVTILDNNGHTIVNRTGGSGERTASKQKSSVFAADNAVYEACFLAKQRGLESLSVHIWSTIRLPQIKNCFEGLETSGLIIDEMLYRPIISFGGCRQKKPWRV